MRAISFSRDVKRAALRRARDRCEQCGSFDALEVHHIGYVKDRSLFNALVLCAPCHLAEHKRRNLRGKRS